MGLQIYKRSDIVTCMDYGDSRGDVAVEMRCRVNRDGTLTVLSQQRCGAEVKIPEERRNRLLQELKEWTGRYYND